MDEQRPHPLDVRPTHASRVRRARLGVMAYGATADARTAQALVTDLMHLADTNPPGGGEWGWPPDALALMADLRQLAEVVGWPWEDVLRQAEATYQTERVPSHARGCQWLAEQWRCVAACPRRLHADRLICARCQRTIP